MNIIFLCGLFPEETKNEIVKKSSGLIQNAANALQWAIVRGLYFYTSNFRLVNLPYVGSFPQRYQDLKLNTFQFSHNGNANDINVGFVNLSLYKSYSRYINAKRQLKKIINKKSRAFIVPGFFLSYCNISGCEV